MTRLDTLEKQAKDIFLGIDSNIGNRINHIERAKSLLLENNIKKNNIIKSILIAPSWGNESKNYKAYKILILKNPEKSGFFADQIRAVEKLINTEAP